MSFGAVVSRDFKLARRRGGQMLPAPAFFVLAVALFPLALGPDTEFLRRAAPGLLSLAALLASLLPLERLFLDDRQDGSLDLLMREPAPLALYAAGKIAAHWLLTGLFLVLATPVMALVLGLPATLIAPVTLIMAGMTLCLTLIGAPAAALATQARQGSILLALLVLPLYIPVLIFGAGAIGLGLEGRSMAAPALLLAALLAVAVPAAPLLTAAILRGEEQ